MGEPSGLRVGASGLRTARSGQFPGRTHLLSGPPELCSPCLHYWLTGRGWHPWAEPQANSRAQQGGPAVPSRSVSSAVMLAAASSAKSGAHPSSTQSSCFRAASCSNAWMTALPSTRAAL